MLFNQLRHGTVAAQPSSTIETCYRATLLGANSLVRLYSVSAIPPIAAGSPGPNKPKTILSAGGSQDEARQRVTSGYAGG